MARALAQAGTVVCAPVHRFELEVPADALGPTLALLARRRRTAHHRARADVRVVGRGDGRGAGRRGAPADPMVPDVTRGEGVLSSRLYDFRPQG